jgi:hypothetical protein
MKQVMEFVKTHLLLLLCGVVGVAAIVFCVLGMTSDAVVEEMKKEISDTGAANIRNLRGQAQNEATIASKKRQGELFEAEYRETVEAAKRVNERKVLMPGVFPEAEKAATPFEFKQEYANTMRVLYTQIEGGTLPTEAEIQEEVQNVEDLRLLEEEQRAEEEGDEGNRTPSATPTRAGGLGRGLAPPTGRGLVPPTGRGLAPPTGRGMPIGRGMAMAPGATGRGGPALTSIRTSDEPKYNPVYRARVAKAKSILCYYDETSFHHSPLEYAQDAPTPEEMWFAQVGLWVQEDVVEAIGELNQEAADQVTETDPCVADVPVKRLVYVRVLGYELPKGETPGDQRILFPMSDTGGMPSTVGGPSLTGRTCDEQFDVVRFVVSVVIDQRDLPKLIDRISRVNFYQCLNARYEMVDHESEIAQGYFYGTDPVVRATFEFEGYMAREVYQPLMPAKVRELLGIKKENG